MNNLPNLNSPPPPRRNIVLFVLLLLVTSATVKYGMQYYREREAVRDTNRMLGELKKEAIKENPDSPEFNAFQEAVSNKIDKNLAAKKSREERRQTAAAMFLGHYLTNQRGRKEYCKEKGVDIGSFVREFERIHSKEYLLAVKALSFTSRDVDNLYRLQRELMRSSIEWGMTHFTSEAGVSSKDACTFYSENPAQLASEMHISLVQPAIHEALLE